MAQAYSSFPSQNALRRSLRDLPRSPMGTQAVRELFLVPRSNPRVKDVKAYCAAIGLDYEVDRELRWLAVEGLTAPTPPEWHQYETDTGDIFYHEPTRGISTWTHPLDSIFRQRVDHIRKYADKQVRNETSRLQAEAVSSRTQLGQLQTDLKNAQQRLATMESDYSVCQKQLVDAETLEAARRSDLLKKDTRIGQLEQECTRLVAENTSLHEKVSHLATANQSLSRRLDDEQSAHLETSRALATNRMVFAERTSSLVEELRNLRQMREREAAAAEGYPKRRHTVGDVFSLSAQESKNVQTGNEPTHTSPEVAGNSDLSVGVSQTHTDLVFVNTIGNHEGLAPANSEFAEPVKADALNQDTAVSHTKNPPVRVLISCFSDRRTPKLRPRKRVSFHQEAPVTMHTDAHDKVQDSQSDESVVVDFSNMVHVAPSPVPTRPDIARFEPMPSDEPPLLYAPLPRTDPVFSSPQQHADVFSKNTTEKSEILPMPPDLDWLHCSKAASQVPDILGDTLEYYEFVGDVDDLGSEMSAIANQIAAAERRLLECRGKLLQSPRLNAKQSRSTVRLADAATQSEGTITVDVHVQTEPTQSEVPISDYGNWDRNRVDVEPMVNFRNVTAGIVSENPIPIDSPSPGIRDRSERIMQSDYANDDRTNESDSDPSDETLLMLFEHPVIYEPKKGINIEELANHVTPSLWGSRAPSRYGKTKSHLPIITEERETQTDNTQTCPVCTNQSEIHLTQPATPASNHLSVSTSILGHLRQNQSSGNSTNRRALWTGWLTDYASSVAKLSANQTAFSGTHLPPPLTDICSLCAYADGLLVRQKLLSEERNVFARDMIVYEIMEDPTSAETKRIRAELMERQREYEHTANQLKQQYAHYKVELAKLKAGLAGGCVME